MKLIEEVQVIIKHQKALMFRTLIFFLLLLLPLLENVALGSFAHDGQPLSPLKVGDSGRYLVTQDDGKPFFWLADTAWHLFHRLQPTEVDRYLEDRAAKGFTVIQTMIVGTDDEFRVSDSHGGLAFEEGDPGRPVEAFFKNVDAIVAKANSIGLRVAIAPTWGNKVRKTGSYKGTKIFDANRARDYGEYLGQRYRDAAVVWIVGGDCLVEKGEEAIWQALAEGLIAGGEGQHLLTSHVRSHYRDGSGWLFHNEPWLDFNFAYSGHIWNAPSYEAITLDRIRTPIKPVIDGEPPYENHPYLVDGRQYHSRRKSWDGKLRGDAHQMREAAYWAMLAGAAGHSYGANEIWQFYDPDRGDEAMHHPNTLWTKALDFDGARQMGILRKLFELFAWETLVPDQSVIAGGQGTKGHHAQAARAVDGSFALIYLPKGGPISVRMDAISTQEKAGVAARWFDPRNGKWTTIGSFKNSGKREFTPPTSGEKNDWVLVLQSAENSEASSETVVSKSTSTTVSSRKSSKELSTRPNILFIISDDQGWADIGYQGKDILTPNLDRLAASGVRLNQHYVHPTCSPTRAGLMFGRFPSRFGVLTPIRTENHLPRNVATLPKLLRNAGYTTHISGKWHLGPMLEYGPSRYGFDTSYGYLHGQIDPYTHRYKFGDTTWHRNGKFVKEEGHATDLITEEAVRVVQSSGDEPFFLYVAYSVPHFPLSEPQRWTGLYDGKIEEPSRKLFAASVSHMDSCIGQLVASVERAGKSEQTLIVFASDNGGQHSWDSPDTQYNGRYAPNLVLGNNLPLRGWKTQLHEGGIRVPAFARWPGVLKPQQQSSAMHIVDWMPTLARVAGCTESLPDNLDGRDMLDALHGHSLEEARPPIYWKTPSVSAVRVKDWKLIVSKSGQTELFNLASDPYEKRDLAKEQAARVESLTKILHTYAKNDREWAPAE